MKRNAKYSDWQDNSGYPNAVCECKSTGKTADENTSHIPAASNAKITEENQAAAHQSKNP